VENRDAGRETYPPSGMLEAVYVDRAASRSFLGIRHKAPFYPLFESLKNQANNKIIVFTAKPVDGKTTSTVMVETGES
jgi:Mrp family chromosome partitioning ATPase